MKTYHLLCAAFLSALVSIPVTTFGLENIACSITTTPTRAAPGEQVTLRWNSINARSVSLDGFGPVPLQGSKIVTASQTSDYKMLVSGYKNNYVGCVARLTVVAKQPTCSISLVPFAIASGSFATLSWSTEFADSVYISGVGNVQPKGNTMVRANGNSTYYLTARGMGGICERSAELAVREQYQNYGYFTPTIQSIMQPLFGNSTRQTYQPTSYSYRTYDDTYYEYETFDAYEYEDEWEDEYYYDSSYYSPQYEETWAPSNAPTYWYEQPQTNYYQSTPEPETQTYDPYLYNDGVYYTPEGESPWNQTQEIEI